MWGPMKNIPVLFPPTEPPKNNFFVFFCLVGCVYYQAFAFAFFFNVCVCIWKTVFYQEDESFEEFAESSDYWGIEVPYKYILKISSKAKFISVYWKSIFYKFAIDCKQNHYLLHHQNQHVRIVKNLQIESDLPQTFAEKGLKLMSNMESEVPWTLIPLIYSWSPNLMKRVEGERGSS